MQEISRMQLIFNIHCINKKGIGLFEKRVPTSIKLISRIQWKHLFCHLKKSRENRYYRKGREIAIYGQCDKALSTHALGCLGPTELLMSPSRPHFD